jgi:predicted  nucleic acid-binding Zn-ribbon protein
MGQASFHVGNHTGHSAEEEAAQLRDEISAIRRQLTDEIEELDRRRKNAVVRLNNFSERFAMIRRIIRLVTMASAAYVTFMQLKNAYQTIRNEWKRHKRNDQYKPA